MKKLYWFLGIVFSLAGLAWILALMGEVFSRNADFTYFSIKLWGYVIFHTVSMFLGLLFIELARKRASE